jgi:hypothetical protein
MLDAGLKAGSTRTTVTVERVELKSLSNPGATEVRAWVFNMRL